MDGRMPHARGVAGADTLLMGPAELPPGPYDRWSKAFIYDVEGQFLEPNGDVTVEVYPPQDAEGVASAVQGE